MSQDPIPCAKCKNPVELGSQYFPFCCERCKMSDLGHWMSENYRISRNLDHRDVDSFDPTIDHPDFDADLDSSVD